MAHQDEAAAHEGLVGQGRRRAVRLLVVSTCTAVGIVLGLGSYCFYYAEGGSYFSNDPRSCVNCHVMRDAYDGWQHASHHAVAVCNDCHVPHDAVGKYLAKAENGFWHSKGFTLQDFHEPIRLKPKNREIVQQNCVSCHRELVDAILGHSLAGAQASDCLRCHAAVGHGPLR